MEKKFNKAALYMVISMLICLAAAVLREYLLKIGALSETQNQILIWFGVAFLILVFFKIMSIFGLFD